LPYDTLKDLVTINMIGTSPMVLAASKKSGITSMKQLMDDSKAKKPFTYGSIGIGSLGHLAIADFAKKTGVDWVHAPYRGGGPMVQDGLAGQVPLVVGSMFLIKPHADSGGLIPLAVTTAKRSPDMPKVPTLAESGYPGFEAPAWWAVIAPSKTPPAIMNAMYRAVDKALNLLVDLTARPRNQAFGTAVHAHRLDRVIDRACRNTLHIVRHRPRTGGGPMPHPE
jgi:tripartite-type tricarboxylate transporter receptor subunit TctC